MPPLIVELNVCCRQYTSLVQLHYLHEVLHDVQEPHEVLHDVQEPHELLHDVQEPHELLHAVQEPHELLHAEQPLEQLQEQSAATTRAPAPTNLAFLDFIKF